MASVFKKSGYKSWRISYLDEHGKRREVQGFTDKKSSETLARELEKQVEQRRLRIATGQEIVESVTVEAAYQKFLIDIGTKGLREKTVAHYKTVLDKLVALFSELTVASVTREKVEEALHTCYKIPAAKTYNVYRQIIRTFFSYCKERDWCEKLPTDKIKPRKTGEGVRQRRAFTSQEFLALLDNCHHRWHTAYKLAVVTGFRRSELRRLKVEHADLSNPARPLWKLPPQVGKSNRYEVLPMHQQCKPIVEELLVGKGSGELLLSWVPSANTTRGHIQKAKIDPVNSSGSRLDFHCLRYTFCSVLAQTLPIQYVRVLMRHASIQQTCDLYMQLGLVDVYEKLHNLPAFEFIEEPPTCLST